MEQEIGELNDKLKEEIKRNLARPCEAHRCQVCQSWLSPKEDCDRKIEDLENQVSDLEYAMDDAKAYLDEAYDRLERWEEELKKGAVRDF